MFVELIESLRCPRDHEESPLIVATSRTIERHVVDGTLGCPVCGAEFTIADGVARFGDPPGRPADAAPSAEAAMRLAAFLELTDARGFALLCGRWGAQADQLRRISETPLVLVNPPSGAGGQDVSAAMLVADAVPFARGAARGAALDEAVGPALAASIVERVRDRGRVVGPVSLSLPAGLTELVRDDREWVAERTAASPPASRLVSITRSRSADPAHG